MESKKVIKNSFVHIISLIDVKLAELSKRIEKTFDSDLIYFSSEITPESSIIMSDVVTQLFSNSKLKNKRLTIIIDTIGGDVNEVAKMVTHIRRLYDHVSFIIPKKALSAGTLFCFSGNNIYMNNSAGLGRIDLQITATKSDKAFSIIEINKRRDLLFNEMFNDERLVSYYSTAVNNLDCEFSLINADSNQKKIIQHAESYLQKYKFNNFSQLDDQKQKMILNIPTLLSTNEDFMIETPYHDSYIYLEKANELGLEVKNYVTEFPEIKKDIFDFTELNDEFSSFKGNSNGFCIYSRIVKNIPLLVNANTISK